MFIEFLFGIIKVLIATIGDRVVKQQVDSIQFIVIFSCRGDNNVNCEMEGF